MAALDKLTSIVPDSGTEDQQNPLDKLSSISFLSTQAEDVVNDGPQNPKQFKALTESYVGALAKKGQEEKVGLPTPYTEVDRNTSTNLEEHLRGAKESYQTPVKSTQASNEFQERIRAAANSANAALEEVQRAPSESNKKVAESAIENLIKARGTIVKPKEFNSAAMSAWEPSLSQELTEKLDSFLQWTGIKGTKAQDRAHAANLVAFSGGLKGIDDVKKAATRQIWEEQQEEDPTDRLKGEELDKAISERAEAIREAALEAGKKGFITQPDSQFVKEMMLAVGGAALAPTLGGGILTAMGIDAGLGFVLGASHNLSKGKQGTDVLSGAGSEAAWWAGIGGATHIVGPLVRGFYKGMSKITEFTTPDAPFTIMGRVDGTVPKLNSAVENAIDQPEAASSVAFKNLSGLGEWFDAMNANLGLRAPAEVSSPLAENLRYAAEWAASSGDERLLNTVIRKQAEAGQNSTLYLSPIDVDFSINESLAMDRGKNIRGFVSRWANSPSVYMKNLARDFVGNPTFALNQADRAKLGFAQNIKSAIRGLRKEESNRVFTVLDEGNALEKAFSVPELKQRGLGNKEIAAYYSMRDTMDQAYILYNDSLARQAKEEGKKNFGKDLVSVNRTPKFVDDTGKALSQKQIENGYVGIEEVSKTPGRRGYRRIIQESELKDPDYVVPYREGYIPRIYNDNGTALGKWHVTIIHPDGATQRVAQFDTQKQALLSKDSWANRIAKEFSEEGEASTPHVIALRDSGSLGAVEMGIDKEFGRFIQNLSEDRFNRVLTALEKDGVSLASVERVRSFGEGLRPSTRRFVGRRGEELIEGNYFAVYPNGDGQAIRTFKNQKDAAKFIKKNKREGEWSIGSTKVAGTLPSNQAIGRYLNQVARTKGINEWRVKGVNFFQKYYGDVLSNPADWNSTVKKEHPFSAEAKTIQDQLRALMGAKSQADIHVDNMLESFADGLPYGSKVTNGVWNLSQWSLEESPTLRKISNWGSSMMRPGTLTKSARHLVARTFLGMWNAMQLPLQASGVLMRAGHSPIHTANAIDDYINYLTGSALARKGIPLDGKQKEMVEALSQSGLVANIRTIDTATLDKSVDSLAGTNWLNYLWKNDFSFFNAGNHSNYAISFFSARREVQEGIRSGKYKFSSINSPEAIKKTNDIALESAMNFSKIDAPRLSKDIAGLFWQFQDFNTKAAERVIGLAASKDWKRALGVSAAWSSIFGAKSLPFILTGAALYNLISDNPTAPGAMGRVFQEAAKDTVKGLGIKDASGKTTRFINNLIQEGATSALTDGELQLAQRFGLSTIGMPFVETAQEGMLPIPGMVVVDKIAQAIKNSEDSIVALHESVDALTWPERAEEYSKIIGRNLLDIASGPRGFKRAYDLYTQGEIRTSSGQILYDDDSLAHVLFIAAGGTPGALRKRYQEVADGKLRYKKQRDWLWDKANRVVREYNENGRDKGIALMHHFESQLDEMGLKSMKIKFMNQVLTEMVASGMSAEQKETLREVQNYQLFPELFNKE